MRSINDTEKNHLRSIDDKLVHLLLCSGQAQATDISLQAIRLFLLSIKSHVMSLIESLVSSTRIKSSTNLLGSGSVCTRSFLKNCTCCTGTNLGNPFLKSLYMYLLHRGPLSANHNKLFAKLFWKQPGVNRPRSDRSYRSILQEQSDLGPYSLLLCLN